MFDYIQYAYKSYSHKADDKKIVIPIMKQDDLRTKLNNPTEQKPAAYKNSNSSSMRFNGSYYL